MSSLWTPGGERPVGREPDADDAPAPAAPGPGDDPTEEELAAHLGELREQLTQTPVETVIANHAYGLFELAALHLSLDPPNLEQAQLAIDAMAALVDGLQGRLGEAEPHLHDGVAQLRLAFVQLKAGHSPS